jgi:hypothetical protein
VEGVARPVVFTTQCSGPGMTDAVVHTTRQTEMQSAAFRVADLTLRYEATDARIRFVVRDAIRPFIIDSRSATPDCVLECGVGTLDPSPLPVSFRAPVWDLRRLANGDEEILFRSTEPWAMLRMNGRFSHGALTYSERRADPWAIFPGDYPIAEYITCRLVGKRGGIHLHASAVTFGNEAYVFIGHSGAGKSTLAHIAELAGGVVLSDDRTIITVDDAGATAWGTPWHGSLERTSPRSARIAGLALIVQSQRNHASRIEPMTALKEIFVRLIQPRLDQREVENTLGAIERLLATVPLHRFEFTPTRDAVDALHDAWGVA